MREVAWVVGSGGLVGSALVRELARRGTGVFHPERSLPWREVDALGTAIDDAVAAFARRVAQGHEARPASWSVYWAAGVGNMTSAPGDFVAETFALDRLLAGLARSGLAARGDGVLALSGSAGAAYGGAGDAAIDETSPVAPRGAYGVAKLDHEARIAAFAKAHGLGAFLARISTVYGAGQAAGKAHGLITHASRNLVRNLPIRIFVPLDTIRDYLVDDDAAFDLVEGARLARQRRDVITRIVAAERATTIAEILSIFRRLARRPLRVVTAATASTAAYTHRVEFRSTIPLPAAQRPNVSLVVGIGRVLAAERAAYARGASPRGANAP